MLPARPAPQAKLLPGILVVRVDAPIYFANVTWVKERVESLIEQHDSWSREKGVPLEYVIVDLTPVTHVDATALHTFEVGR